MPDPIEPENLTLHLLREMRVSIEAMTSILKEHDKRFDSLERKFDDLSTRVTFSLGLAATANIKHEEAEAKFEEWKAAVRRIDLLEFRVSKLEERPTS